ncbi:hypothetical protein AB0K00_54340 [Dactylosporangium sp. NPDC049525]|uniref:hypothetical protein n=1 Tax=Dactylosporangium sp. NPDC049525 TaxID=3154730 RepID=UPI003428F0F3
MRQRIAGMFLTAVTAATLAVAGGATAAYADQGWIGQCHPQQYGGWCDGNGPDWQYRGFVSCAAQSSGSKEYYGPFRWAGDRTGSTAKCSLGTSYKSGGVKTYYKGTLVGTHT